MDPRPTPYSRLDPEASGRFRKSAVAAPTRSQRATEWVLFGAVALLVVVGAIALYTSYSSQFQRVPNTVAQGIESDRVNLLLLGVGGDTHPSGGDDHADAIILASFKPSTKQVAIVSLPRDLYLPIGRYGRHRLNRAHYIGRQSGYPGGGPGLTADTIATLLDQPVHGFVRVDFAAFEKIIDDLGGVDIEVKRGFHDFLFKDTFKAGKQRMNGKRALQYARYRYVNGPEGDNFARELRQQQVITAVQKKLRSMGTSDVLPLIRAGKTLSANTDTNLTTAQMLWFYQEFRNVDQEQVRHVSLKPFMEKFELRSIADPGEAVRPRGGNFAQLKQLERNIFSDMRQFGTPDDIRLASGPIVTQQSAVIPANYKTPAVRHQRIVRD